jgi:two-component system sensor histidine kinase BarA
MRTPLGAIIGFSEMLDAGVYGALAPKQKDAVTDIQDSAGQLLLFVNNLIGQAQFETGKILIKPKLFPTNELIDSCKSSVLLPATRKGLEIVCQLDPALPQLLYGDVYWLRQIALNLINNAVKFTDHGCITIRLYQPDPDRWAIEVADTGVGISKEAQVAIFEPFRKSDDPLARERAGSGLGLAIVKELCSLMDAQVSLVSQPGEGSTFTVYFPFTVKESIA